VARPADQTLGIEIPLPNADWPPPCTREGVGDLASDLINACRAHRAGDGFQRDARFCVLLEEGNRARESITPAVPAAPAPCIFA